MNHIHPNARAATLSALALLCCLNGCRTQQGGLANPFLAPNRVPPPSTRAILPGQATPYYPGDPLPVMQSAAPQPAAPLTTNAIAAQSIPSADTDLSWNAPLQQPAPAAASTAPRSLTIDKEPPLAIPGDSDGLRFALPTAAPDPVAVAAAPAPMQRAQPAAPPQPQREPVVQASYTEPDMSRSLTNLSAPNAATFAAASNTHWQSPRIMQQRMAAVFAPQPINRAATISAPPLYAAPQNQPLVTAVSNSMSVEMRAIPSPPPVPGDPMPRMRVPGYVQTAQPSVDGFRPRSSMK
jgi:hypothetical protein